MLILLDETSLTAIRIPQPFYHLKTLSLFDFSEYSAQMKILKLIHSRNMKLIRKF